MQAFTSTLSLSLTLRRPPKSFDSSVHKTQYSSFISFSNPKPLKIFIPASTSAAPPESEYVNSIEGEEEDGFEIEVRKVEKRNRRIIESRIRVDADLETVWSILTDYEGLADFIPGLAVSQLMEKGDKFAKLYQVGQQNLALGLKFDAKGVVECFERDVEILPSGRRRDIEFKMVEGDFKLFEGKWSIEQVDNSMCKEGEFQTILSYVVELEPKLRLPVGLLEGRICNEVKINLVSIREEAQRVQKDGADKISDINAGFTEDDEKKEANSANLQKK